MNNDKMVIRYYFSIIKVAIYRSLLIIAFVLSFLCFLFTESYAIKVNKRTLQNGLVVLHSESHNLPIVMVTLLIKVSHLNEPVEKAGLANLTAELLTEGTKNRTSSEISEEIEFIGATLDVNVLNDYTTISLSVLKKDIQKGFELFSDILLNPVFPEEELERKKGLIKGIIRQWEEDPSFLAEHAFKKEVFGDFPYGRLIEGSIDTLDAIKRDDIISFYKSYFLPNNSILSVAGDLTEEELSFIIDRYLKNWEKSILPPVIEHKIDVRRSKKTVKIDKDLTQANIILGHIGISRSNPDYYAISIMNYILGGGGFSSRLMQKIREEKGLAYDVNSAFISNKESGLFQVEVQTKNETANAVISEILNQLKNIRQNLVSDMELSEAKSYLTGSFLRKLDTTREIADFFAFVEFHNLGLDYVDKYSTYINSITKEDILKVAQKYLDIENYILVVVADQEKASIKY